MIDNPALFIKTQKSKARQDQAKALLQSPENRWRQDMEILCNILKRLLPYTKTLFACLGMEDRLVSGAVNPGQGSDGQHDHLRQRRKRPCFQHRCGRPSGRCIKRESATGRSPGCSTFKKILPAPYVNDEAPEGDALRREAMSGNKDIDNQRTGSPHYSCSAGSRQRQPGDEE